MTDIFYENDIVDYLNDINADVYENIPVYEDNDFKIRLITVTEDGVFLVIPKRKDYVPDIEKIKKKFYLGQYIYCFLTGSTNSYFYDGTRLHLVDDLYLSFKGLFEAVLSGQYTIKSHAKHEGDIELEDILSLNKDTFTETEHNSLYTVEKTSLIKTAIEKELSSSEEKKSPWLRRVEKTVNGQTYVRRYNSFGKEEWCLVDESVDPDEHAKTAAFFGFIGLHHFTEGKIGSGILYIICFFGCFGILPAFDVLSMAGGSYRLKNGNYLGRVRNKKKALLNLIVTALIGIILFAFCHSALSYVSTSISDYASDRITEETADMTDEELIDYYSGILSDFGYSEEEIEKYMEEALGEDYSH